MENCSYFVYHDEGHYDYLNGSFRDLTHMGIDYRERYDIVGNFGKLTLDECIDYMNECRAHSSPKRKPIKVKFVVKWVTGRPQLLTYERRQPLRNRKRPSRL